MMKFSIQLRLRTWCAEPTSALVVKPFLCLFFSLLLLQQPLLSWCKATTLHYKNHHNYEIQQQFLFSNRRRYCRGNKKERSNHKDRNNISCMQSRWKERAIFSVLLPPSRKDQLYLRNALYGSIYEMRGGSTSRRQQQKKKSQPQLQPQPQLDDKVAVKRKGIISEHRRRQIILMLVTLALFNDMLQVTMLLPILPNLVSSPPPLGVKTNTAEIAMGFFFASKDICQLTFAPIAGYLTSKTSPKTALIASTTGLGIATLGFAHANTFVQLLLSRSCQGAASAAVMCGGLSLVAETFPSSMRGSSMGIAYMGVALGILSGPLVGGFLYQRFGRRKTFKFAATFVLFNACAQVVLMRAPSQPYEGADVATATTVVTKKNKRDNSKRKEHRENNKDNNSSSSKKGERPASAFESFRIILSNREVLTVAASIFCVHAVVGVMKPLSMVVLDRELNMGVKQRSLMITVATFGYLIGTPIAAYFSDRISRSKLVSLSLLLMSLSTVFFSLRRGMGETVNGLIALITRTGTSTSSYNLWAIYCSLSLLGISLAFNGSVAQALLADLVDKHNLGDYSMAFALSDMSDSLGLIIGPILGLSVSQLLNSPSAGATLIGSFSLLLLPFMLQLDKNK